MTTVVQTVRYPVAVKEIKAGTVIDDEFIDKLTQVRPFAGPAPADVIIDLVAHKGKVLLQDVVADRYLNEAVLGEKVRNIPMAEVKTPEPVKTPVEVKKPVETWDTSILTGSGTKTYRFVRFEKNGEWKMIGEVQADGTVNSSALPNLQPKPETPKEVRQDSPVMARVYLSSSSLRSGNGNEPTKINLKAGTESVYLRLKFKSEEEFVKYRVELRDESGNLISNQNLKNKNALGIAVSAKKLRKGNYKITLKGAKANQDFEDLDFYNFSIEKK